LVITLLSQSNQPISTAMSQADRLLKAIIAESLRDTGVDQLSRYTGITLLEAGPDLEVEPEEAAALSVEAAHADKVISRFNPHRGPPLMRRNMGAAIPSINAIIVMSEHLSICVIPV